MIQTMRSAIKPQLGSRYKDVTDEKACGATYTPKNLADFVAGQIVSQLAPVRPTAPLRVLDPAMGEAALLVSLLNQLKSRGIEELDVYGFDTDKTALKKASERLERIFPFARLHFSSEDFLDSVDYSSSQDTLFGFDSSTTKYDLIIANPPYVRTQVLGANLARRIARRYRLAGRVDLYYPFILAMGSVLAKGGTAGIIVSNRFMTTRSGASVRKAILDSFHVKHIWDLGDTKLFDAAVLPAVLLLQQQKANHRPYRPAFSSIYEIDDNPTVRAKDPIEALEHAGTVSVQDGRRFRVQHGKLDLAAHEGDIWRVATNSSDAWLATIKAHTWGTFSDIGSIRVGIKTCADNVFIRSDWTGLPEHQQPELLRPLTTHHIARRFRSDSRQCSTKVVYPHAVVNGQRQAADLSLYPKTKAYFEAHRDILSARKYVTAGGRQWYEIWVPQDPDAWADPKLVFRDISEIPTFWIDQEGTVVNGDCYWLSARSNEHRDLLWLALAVSNSTFIEAFYDRSFNNKLYAGRRRFMTQYVERFPLPKPSTALARQLIALSKKIYGLTPSAAASTLERDLDRMVWTAFGLSQSD
jgi:adenine-specific DNA-methyltransferase